MSALTTINPPSLPLEVVPSELPTDLLGDTLVHEGLVEALNELLVATEAVEQRLPLARNAFGQWCTRGVGGWRPHASYMDAYAAAHAEEVC